MAVYFKFKSAKDYDSIPIDGHFISVSTLKEKIFESKHLGRGTDFDLVVTNAHTNEEYLDEDMLIPKNTSVLIRRVPGRPRMPIVTEPVNEQYEPKIENNQSEDIQTAKSSFPVVDSSTAGYPEDVEWDEFGTDLYTIPEAQASQLSNLIHDNTTAHSKEDEDSKIKALIDTPVLDWQRQVSDGFGAGRGFGRGGGRMMGARGFGRGGGVLERKTPPPGYICHRCKVSGHFIQHCPTNGDPNFDIKRVKPPTGIPKSMLMATPDGSYSLPSGAAAVMKPNDDAFLRDIIGLPSTHLVSDLPPELRCPLCAEVMKDAVLTSKCCFRSFCDKCIRNYFMSKKMCVCGAKNILADDLLPNKTVRDTISRLMESTNSSQENVGSTLQVQDMESKFPEPNLKDKSPSPTVSATSKGKEVVPPHADEVLKANESSAQVKAVVDSSDKMLEKSGTGKVPDVSEATHDSVSVKEPASQISAPLMDEEVQQKPIISDAGKKKKKKKTRPPMNAAEMQWKMSQDHLAAENYMMPMGGPAAYNPYWNGMQPGMEAYGAPHYPGSLPYMGYGFSGPLDPFGMMPQDPFVGVQQGFMMPPIHPPPQRDLAELGMGFNMGHHPHQPPPPIMSREEFEARKADLRMKREFERRGAAVGGGERRDLLLPKDQQQQQQQPTRSGARQISSSSRDGPQQQLKPKPKIAASSALPPPSSDYRHRPERSSPERSARGPDARRPSSKRKSSEYEQEYDRREDHHRESRDRDRDRDREHHNHNHRHGSSHHRADSSVAARSSSPSPPLPQQQQMSSKTSLTSSKLKPSVFSRISFPEGEKDVAAEAGASASASASKKRKMHPSGSDASAHHHHKSSENGHRHDDYKKISSSSKTVTSGSVTTSRKSASTAAAAAGDADYESSDDDRHFKRRPSRYESSPTAAVATEHHEDSRYSRGTRDRERERDRDRGDRKHR